VTDPHFTDKNPPAYKIDYLDMLEEALDSVFRYAAKQEADAIIWGGDLFHSKSPAQNTHTLVARVIRTMRKAGAAATVNAGILGNHDYPFGDMMRGLPGQPAETLLESHTYHLLDQVPPNNAKELPLDIPHGDIVIDAGDHTLRLAGNSYRHARAEPVMARKKEGSTYLLSVGHFWFGRQTGEFFGEPVFGPDFLENSEVDAFFIGHHHEDQGIQEVNGKTYVSCGSITRTGKHKHDIERRPAAVIFQTTAEKLSATLIRPKFPSAADSMDLETVKQNKQETAEFDALVTALELAETTSLDPRQILAELPSTSLEARARALSYLEKAEE